MCSSDCDLGTIDKLVPTNLRVLCQVLLRYSVLIKTAEQRICGGVSFGRFVVASLVTLKKDSEVTVVYPDGSECVGFVGVRNYACNLAQILVRPKSDAIPEFCSLGDDYKFSQNLFSISPAVGGWKLYTAIVGSPPVAMSHATKLSCPTTRYFSGWFDAEARLVAITAGTLAKSTLQCLVPGDELAEFINRCHAVIPEEKRSIL